MNMLSRYSPRRYFINEIGERVLIGLTVQETQEFEALDERINQPGLDGQQAESRASPIVDEQRRWHELYKKHKVAWQGWLENSSFQR
jgi:hypothetical protein